MATRPEIPAMCSPKCKYYGSGSTVCLSCIGCSEKCPHFGKNSTACLKCRVYKDPHRYNCNEISRKGRSFESYERPDVMVDDRDIVSEILPDYKREFMSPSLSSARTNHPYVELAKRTGIALTEVAYEQIKRFIYELCELNEKEREYLFATVEIYRKGKPSKIEEDSSYTQFAKDHGLPVSATTRLRQGIIRKSPIAAAFIVLLNGSLQGTRGRKSQFVKTFKELHPKDEGIATNPKKSPSKRRKVVSFNCTQKTFDL